MKISKSFKYYCLHISVVVLNASVTSLCIGCNHPVIISLLGVGSLLHISLSLLLDEDFSKE